LCPLAIDFQSANRISAVQAVGYESIFVIDDYHPATQGSWWSSLLRQSTPSCDPHRILQGDAFQTNVSTFNYVVDHINATANKVDPYSTTHSSLSGFEYAADPLAAACNEQIGDRTLRIMADLIHMTVTGSVSFCVF
jgi:hypothetical protein